MFRINGTALKHYVVSLESVGGECLTLWYDQSYYSMHSHFSQRFLYIEPLGTVMPLQPYIYCSFDVLLLDLSS
jgi:hypothetical protein